MKKVLTLISAFALAACAGSAQNTYVVAATQGEMAARNLETPEQTAERHNATLAQINSTLPEGVSFGDTCKDVLANVKMDKEIIAVLDKNTEEMQEAYKKLRKKFPTSAENRCDVCKAKETEKLLGTAYTRKELLQKPGLMFGGSMVQISDEAFVAKVGDVLNMCKTKDTAEANEYIAELKTMLLDMKGSEHLKKANNMLNMFDCSGACAGETLSTILSNYQ